MHYGNDDVMAVNKQVTNKISWLKVVVLALVMLPNLTTSTKIGTFDQ